VIAMPAYDALLRDTEPERERFLALPLIRQAVTNGVPRALYLDFLAQAYHHVRHTCPLLALAYANCDGRDAVYRAALLAYLDVELGHEEWVLDDISALGGDAEQVRGGQPQSPCKAMVGYAYYAIEHVSPYALLGMVHVLEGMSAALALQAAERISDAIGGDAGFSYLRSHGAADLDHVELFRTLLDRLDPPSLAVIVAATRDFYWLYGQVFSALGERWQIAHAA
jgi:pyrroloquinoline quinone (PQQ) biosynthesis protein C